MSNRRTQDSPKKVSTTDTSSGTSIRESKATAAFARALELVKSRTRKPSSSSGSRSRDAVVHGIRPRRLFPRSRSRVPDDMAIGAASVDDDGIGEPDSYIGAKYLDEIYDETFQSFRDERAKEGS